MGVVFEPPFELQKAQQAGLPKFRQCDMQEDNIPHALVVGGDGVAHELANRIGRVFNRKRPMALATFGEENHFIVGVKCIRIASTTQWPCRMCVAHPIG